MVSNPCFKIGIGKGGGKERRKSLGGGENKKGMRRAILVPTFQKRYEDHEDCEPRAPQKFDTRKWAERVGKSAQ